MKLQSIALAVLFSAATPSPAAAAIVFETTGWVVGTDAETYSFTADVTPLVIADDGSLTYEVTLADLSLAPSFEFEALFLSLTTSTETVQSIVGPGSFKFAAVENETYHVNIFGIGGGDFEAGLYGIEVAAVPVPSALVLFASAVAGLGVRRRASTLMPALPGRRHAGR